MDIYSTTIILAFSIISNQLVDLSSGVLTIFPYVSILLSFRTRLCALVPGYGMGFEIFNIGSGKYLPWDMFLGFGNGPHSSF